MKKKLFYRLFGIGKIPEGYQTAIQSEGVILSDEGIGGTVTYLNFRSPQRISNWKRQWYIAAIVMTQTRLLGFRSSITLVDVPYSDERFRGLRFSLEDETYRLIDRSNNTYKPTITATTRTKRRLNLPEKGRRNFFFFCIGALLNS